MNEFLNILVNEWDRLSPSKKNDPAAALGLVVRMCAVLVEKGTHYAPEDEQYVGYYTVSGILELCKVPGCHKITLINRGVFDIWVVVTEQATGKRLIDEGMDALFPIEFATNLKKDQRGRIVLVSQKLLCFDVSENVPVTEMMYGSSSVYVPDMNVLDFVWNVLYLKLSTPKKLIEWVRCERSTTYFLDNASVKTLISQGRHEVYAATELEDTAYALKSIIKVVDAVYSKIIENTYATENTDCKSDDEDIDIE